MNLMHFLSRAIQPPPSSEFFTTGQFPLDDEEIADKAINAMLLIMHNASRSDVNSVRFTPRIEDYVALVGYGVLFPWKDRITLNGQIDQINDELPRYACVGMSSKRRDTFAEALYISEPTSLEWKNFPALRGAKKVWRTGWIKGYAKLSRAYCDDPTNDLESLVDFYYAGMMPDGQCVGCAPDGYPDFLSAKWLAYVVGVHNDRRYFWNVSATEEFFENMPAKAHFAIDEEYVKSLFYARSVPITAKGRLRPIMHWVQAHKRRIKEGIDIDVRKHLRGINAFTMHGVNFAIDQPCKVTDTAFRTVTDS